MLEEKEIIYDKVGGYISEICFNNGQTVSINPNDIVIFVGPNNAGKSQSLKDINELCYDSKKVVRVISKIKIQKSKHLRSILL